MSLPYLQPYLGLSNGLNTLHAAGGGGGGAAGGWVELGRTTLGSTSTQIDVTGLANKRYLKVIRNVQRTSGNDVAYRVGNNSFDSGSNYSSRESFNGGSEYLQTSQTENRTTGGTNNQPLFGVTYITNYSSDEKLFIGHVTDSTASGISSVNLTRGESYQKWANTSTTINQIRTFNMSAGNFIAGSEVIVLGFDPADAGTSGGFWQELASVDLSGGASSTLSSGNFSSKKYLWVEGYIEHGGPTGYPLLRVGNGSVDSGTSYSTRVSFNDAADGAYANQTSLWYYASVGVADSNAKAYFSFFVLNEASKEKLFNGQSIVDWQPGASIAPTQRQELVNKWANTSNQIDIIDLTMTTGTLGTKSYLRVFGAD